MGFGFIGLRASLAWGFRVFERFRRRKRRARTFFGLELEIELKEARIYRV